MATTTFVETPTGRVPIEQMTAPLEKLLVAEDSAWLKTPTGTSLLTITLLASEGPAFDTVTL